MFRRSILNKKDLHIHEDRIGLKYKHNHHTGNVHLSESKRVTPWLIFIIFMLGPCEFLISFMIYPAASDNFLAVVDVASLFSIVAQITMLLIVFVGIFELSFFLVERILKHIDALAGISIIICGISIQF